MRAVTSTVSSIAALALLGLASFGSAHATTVTWNFSGGCTQDCGTDGPNGNVRTFTGSDGLTSVMVSAWSFTENNNTTLETSFLGHYSGGLGVTNRDEGSGSNNRHTLDNYSQFDLIAFYFGSETVIPSQIRVTAFNDTDLSIWVGTIQNAPGLGGLTEAQLDALFGNHFNVSATGSPATANIGNNLGGNLLLVAANVDYDLDDKVKIKSLTVTLEEPQNEVPDVVEPASLAVFALGVFGIAGLRRRRPTAA